MTLLLITSYITPDFRAMSSFSWGHFATDAPARRKSAQGFDTMDVALDSYLVQCAGCALTSLLSQVYRRWVAVEGDHLGQGQGGVSLLGYRFAHSLYFFTLFIVCTSPYLS